MKVAFNVKNCYFVQFFKKLENAQLSRQRKPLCVIISKKLKLSLVVLTFKAIEFSSTENREKCNQNV